MCLIVTIISFYFSINSFMAGSLTAGFLQGAIALLFLGLLARNIYVVSREKQGCSVSGCKITDSIAKLFKRKEP